MYSPVQNLDHLKIPLKDILKATNHFSDENFIRQDGFGKTYKGKLLRSRKSVDIVARRLDITNYVQGSKIFWTEVSMLSSLKHENIVSIVGFCDEKNEKIVINKYEAKGSLDNYVSDPSLTWLQRLKICVGVAHALNYIHYDEKRDFSVIHRNIKSSKILLDDNYVPKLSGFELSMTTISSRRHRVCLTDDVCGTPGYLEPTYEETGGVTHKSDMYSFGVLLFEVIINESDTMELAQLSKFHYEKGQLDDLIDPDLRKQMDQESFNIFAATAYYCLQDRRAERLNIDQIVIRLDEALNLQREQENLESAHSTSSTCWKGSASAGVYTQQQALEYLEKKKINITSSSVQNLDHFKIPLEDILEATNHFSKKNFIRQGGFGKIYKGQLKRSGKLINIVARRLDSKRGQGAKQFWTEILMLSKLKDANLVSLVGFCDEKNEKIVINKYEAKGSLDNYLSDPTVTWLQRLKICVGVARALSYIHYDAGRDFSVIHRNIKSSKILLGHNYVPKLAGFELSMMTIASQRDRFCIDDACGSIGYVDPTYATTGSVTHKSDIYSFGVVLFEVLLGMKAITDKRDIKLAEKAKSRYENKKLDDRINRVLRKQMDGESLEVFLKIAYDCVKEHPAGRPSIVQVLIKLEKALHLQQSKTERELIFEQLEANVCMLRNPADKRASERLIGSFAKAAFEAMNFDIKRRSLIQEMELIVSERSATDYFSDRLLLESQEEKNNLRISLDDIKLATQDFSNDNVIGQGGFGQVYKGKLPCAGGHKLIAAKRLGRTSDQGETELRTELEILFEYKHINVIDIVSYCNENGEKVIVYDYASRGSLDKWLKRKELTWRKRLEICIDIARGLDFLHGTSNVKQEVVIHRDIKSANILLHGDWKASIADFGLSLISPINQDINYVIDNAKGTPGYCDPLYINTKTLTKESDIYSFGVLLFEMLCGRFVIENENSKAQDLVCLVRHHFEEGTLCEMVFVAIKKQMAAISATIFQNIAYRCIHVERSKRPTASDVLIQLKRALEIQEKWEDLNISLDDIMLDTRDFSHDNLIGKGDFWSLYKGRVTCADGCEMIAAKRSDRRSDQRETERMTELEILLKYTHENIISLVGYCNEKGEKIMVYEFASISKGSLDRWLKYDGLTWRKRLEICIDIAMGLAFLHGTSREKKEVVLHGDIKCENVLLNNEWKAKIANFGQSLTRPGYCDPLYTTTEVLNKESDVYSLGVLLFEMLCGRSVMEHNSSRAHNFIHWVRDRFEEGTLYEIVFEATKKQMVPASLTAFQSVAYQCIHEEREKRPTAEDVLIQLKKALEFQEVMERLTQMTDSPEIYHVMNNTDLYTWPNKGILLRDHKVMFSFGTYGMVETISATEFQFKSYYRPNKWRTLSKSRFGEVVQISDSSSMNIHISVKTQLLSPGVNYGVYLVYKFCRPIDESTHKLAIKMGSEDLFPEFTTRRDNDGWMRIELHRFSNLKEEANFDASLKGFSEDPFKNVAIYVEGVEFQPISNMTREEIKQLKKTSITNGGGSIHRDEDGGVWFWVKALLLCPCIIGYLIFKACNESEELRDQL